MSDQDDKRAVFDDPEINGTVTTAIEAIAAPFRWQKGRKR